MALEHNLSLQERRDKQAAEQAEKERREIEARQKAIIAEQEEYDRAAKYDLWRVIQEQPQDFPIDVGTWNILIEMYEPRRTMGRFVKTQEQIDQEQYLTVIGRVLKCGPTAFDGKTTSGIDCSKVTAHCQSPEELEGRYVIIQRYTGNEIYFAPYPAKKLRFITLQEVLAVTSVPTMFMKQ